MAFPAKSHITHLKGWWWYLQVQSQCPGRADWRAQWKVPAGLEDRMTAFQWLNSAPSYFHTDALVLCIYFLVRITSFPSFPFLCFFLCNSALFAFQPVPSFGFFPLDLCSPMASLEELGLNFSFFDVSILAYIIQVLVLQW